uniref:Uncharacterized protein n=1 Tax=Trypanosoma vivax (strain Y486) TaxID=1055687 RepID=G0TSN1_TRYVY|nr:hypothetical protein, unlikely [Trypanosoma vivax Y486]
MCKYASWYCTAPTRTDALLPLEANATENFSSYTRTLVTIKIPSFLYNNLLLLLLWSFMLTVQKQHKTTRKTNSQYVHRQESKSVSKETLGMKPMKFFLFSFF